MNLFGFLRIKPQVERTAQHLRSSQLELTSVRDRLAPADAQQISELLEEASKCLGRKDVDGSWHFLNEARRNGVAARPQEELADLVSMLEVEAVKLSPWRRRTVETLLRLQRGESIRSSAVRDAMACRDEYYENRYHRIAMTQQQLRIIVTTAVSALLVIILISASIDSIDALGTWDWRMLLLVLAFGVIGASFSAARNITADSTRTTIPELMLSNSITLARTVLGASPALAVYAFLHARLVDLGTLSPEKAFAIAFAAGFSERLIVRVTETIAGGSSKDK
jgi:hypothetical protein